MKFKVKLLSLLLVLVMIVAMMAGCGQETGEGTSEETGGETAEETGEETAEEEDMFPIAKQPITIEILAELYPGHPADWNDAVFWQEYEKLTGIHVQWDLQDGDHIVDRKKVRLSSGDYPDAIFTNVVNNMNIVTYGPEGVFLKLNDLIDQYAPNLKALMEQYPIVEKALTTSDGNIYSFPALWQGTYANTFWFNKKWMSQLGLSMPTTTEEFYNVLKAMKEQDPNGNGQADELPFMVHGLDFACRALRGAWGLGNRNIWLEFDSDPQTGKVRYIPASPQYRDMLQYLNRLYAEGLLPTATQNVGDNEIKAAMQANTVGVWYGGHGPAKELQPDNWESLKAPLKGPNGDQVYNGKEPAPNVGIRSFVITSANKYVPETMKWVDYWYSDEGAKMYQLGVKDVTYIEDSKGQYYWTDLIIKNPDGLAVWEAKNRYLPPDGGPTHYSGKFVTVNDKEVFPEYDAAAKSLADFALKSDEAWPTYFWFTPEENANVVTPIGNEIYTYMTDMRTKFVLGEVPFTEWDNYVNTLNEMGLPKLLEAYEAAVARLGK